MCIRYVNWYSEVFTYYLTIIIISADFNFTEVLNIPVPRFSRKFYFWVSVHHKSIIYNKPTRCNSGSIVFINNYKYALHVSDAPCVHHQEHYKL